MFSRIRPLTFLFRGLFYAAGMLSAVAQVAIMPLSEVRAGQKGIGKTVFEGTKIAEFGVEILGVLPNLGPKQSIILGRLTGPEVTRTGVMQGMSGSPVYIDGKLVGAVALAFNFSKEPIAGIRPIQDMLAATPTATPRTDVRAANSEPNQLVPIATPVSFSGFAASTLQHFAPELRKLGLEPRQAVSSGSSSGSSVKSGLLEPGAMISVQLMSGDMAVAADGTVTHVDGDKIYAFGHEFMQLGEADLPFARASVIALLPSVATSFKISAAQEWLGAITHDQTAGIRGQLGRQPSMIPLTISVNGPGGSDKYSMQMARDPVLTPFLLSMATLSTLEARQRVLGSNSIALKGRVKFADLPDLELGAISAGDFGVPQQVAQSATFPLQALLQGGFGKLKPQSIELNIETANLKRFLQLDQLSSSRRVVRPGESVNLTAVLIGDEGIERRETIAIAIPKGISPGMITISVGDALSVAFARYTKVVSNPPLDAASMIGDLNRFSRTNRLYVRLIRSDQSSYQMRGQELSAPPPSISQVLRKDQNTPILAANLLNQRINVVAEQEVDLGTHMVAGNRSIQLEVKEN